MGQYELIFEWGSLVLSIICLTLCFMLETAHQYIKQLNQQLDKGERRKTKSNYIMSFGTTIMGFIGLKMGVITLGEMMCLVYLGLLLSFHIREEEQ